MSRKSGKPARRSRIVPPAPPAAPPAATRRTIALVLLVFVVLFTSLQVFRYTRTSATWDEPVHLTAGYVALAHGDFRVEPSHPPFMREWAALPVLLTQHADTGTAEIDRTPVRQWFDRGYDFARRFLYVKNDADRLLYRARFMIVIWGAVLGLLVFAWTYEWLGFPSAVAALAFYTFEPNLVAHAALVTTDFGVTCFMFGAVYFLWRTSRHFTAANVAGTAACVALAAITKFSAVLLAPIGAVLVLVALATRSEMTRRRAAILVAATAGVTLVAIWAAYGFRYRPSPSATWLMTRDAIPNTARVPWLAAIVSWVDAHHLLPNAYSQGFLLSQASARILPAFLRGTIRAGGWWYYFPVAFILKTPVSLLALTAGGLLLLVSRRRKFDGLTTTFLVVPPIVYLAAAMASGINLGVRHILPVYPFVILIAAGAARELAAHRRPMARVAIAVLAVAWGGEFVRAYPHPLTFFNVLAGGPKNGFRYLADSNLGWGSNLKPLKRWMDRHDVRHINLAYFGTADPAYYGIEATYLPGSAMYLDDHITRPKLPGYVAISPTVLDGVYLPPWWRAFYAGFRTETPVAVVGNSLRVYWVNTWPEPPPEVRDDPQALLVLADGLVDGLNWPERAAEHYREVLRREPRNSAAWNGLGVAFTRTGRLRDAADCFRRASELAPGDPTPRRNLDAVLGHLAR